MTGRRQCAKLALLSRAKGGHWRQHLLRSLGYHSPVLDKAASTAYLRDGDNPLFEYLVSKRSQMLEQITKKCPSKAMPSLTRFQWFPERGEGIQKDRNKTAWAESMYWDCIFLDDLYEHGVHGAVSRRAGPDPFSNLSNAFEDGRQALAQIKSATQKIEALLQKIDNTVKPDFCKKNPNNEICKALPSPSRPCVSIEQCGRDAFCRDHPNNTLCAITNPLPRPTPTCPCRGAPLCYC